MKTIGVLFLATVCFLVVPNLSLADNPAAINEVLKLKNAGLGDDSIVAYIRNKNQNYELSAETIISLRDQGVSPVVLNAMMSSGAGNVSGGPASVPIASTPPPLQPQFQFQPGPVASPVAGGLPTANPEVAYFYQELSPYGNWLLGDDHQWYWQPQVASDPAWRPYWDSGHWVNTDHGWYWSSDYPWGWAAFHYGRWQLHPHHGWIWQPDRVWGPAWVAWRSGGDYCGWAPLPPGSVFDAGAGVFLFHGARVEAGFDFGLDWNHFTFCALREMGDPFRMHFREGPEFRNIYGRTTIVNRYSVNTGFGGPHAEIINHGIDPARVAAARGRAVEVVKVGDLRTPTPNRGHERMNPETKTIDVYRPRFTEPSHGKDEHERGK